MRFDEVWYNLDQVYIFYSLKMDAVSPFDRQGERLDNVDRLTLSEIALRRNGEEVGIASRPVTLDIGYDSSEERIETIPLSKSYEAMNRKIQLVRLEMGTSENRLFFRYAGKDTETLYRAEAALRTDKGELRGVAQLWPSEDGVYELDFQPFDKRPSKIAIEWGKIIAFDRSLKFEFKLDAEKIVSEASKEPQGWRKQADERIDRLLDTDIELGQLFYDDRGLDFTVRYAADSPQEKPYLRLYSDLPNFIRKGTVRPKPEDELPELVRVTNERGEDADIGQSGGGNNAFDAFIDKAFIDGSKEVTVTVSNPYTEWNFDWKSDAAVPAGE